MAPSSREATARARAPRSKRRSEPRCTGSSSRLNGAHRSHAAVCGFAQDDVACQNPPHLSHGCAVAPSVADLARWRGRGQEQQRILSVSYC
ncbi:hypothetical protein E2562_039162 [Oryza meyeriana var. granulata]|uniref:Uncharacterized protein n=1 Tax=Oryza meyeriana var. granulata TaxID=110450 RepID=A0A6G1CMJ6_9ORYZ|nr:hypothetical protein E2562_039162 [Oryza meyeriana var. granulata]